MVENPIGSISYKLHLPSSTFIHDVFQVSQLKLCPNPQGHPIQHLHVIVPQTNKVPMAILDRKMVKKG